jgi:SAM-dependent methyltransferase
MTDGSYRQDPLTPEEREEFEDDLVSFCDRELDLLGDIRGMDVLYAGGSSLLWVEGLSQRAGEEGTVTALDRERVEVARENLEGADLRAPVRLVEGSVFEPPFDLDTFDLVYSAGLFHELDVSRWSAEEALLSLASVARPGGRLATEDFVDTVPAVQLEDENLDAALARLGSGRELFGIGPPGRLVALHEGFCRASGGGYPGRRRSGTWARSSWTRRSRRRSPPCPPKARSRCACGARPCGSSSGARGTRGRRRFTSKGASVAVSGRGSSVWEMRVGRWGVIIGGVASVVYSGGT